MIIDKIGFIKVVGTNHDDIEKDLPDINNLHRVLLVDSEVKSGKSIANVSKILFDKYNNKDLDIKNAVLAVCLVEKEIDHIVDICKESYGPFIQKQIYLPDFLAYISKYKIEPLGDIR